jgi:hypothetical protein
MIWIAEQSFRFFQSRPMSKVSTSTARDQALRDSLLVRFAAAAAAGNIDTKKALNHEATYLGIQLNKTNVSTPGIN